MHINFREITTENWHECANLSVTKEQENFVAPNSYSLTQALYDDDEWITRAIYDDATMIGFIMYGVNDDETSYICRYMIDKRYQGKGYGKAALAQILDLLKNTFKCKEVGLSEVPENYVAKKLYGSLGFEFTGEIDDGEEVMVKRFS